MMHSDEALKKMKKKIVNEVYIFRKKTECILKLTILFTTFQQKLFKGF